ncbi:MAG: o-succinylbenzoate synthase [Myxococcota bacterium]
MRLVAARLTRFRLRLASPLETGHGRLREREGVLLELEARGGAVGWGEALPLPGFGLEPVARTWDALEGLARDLLARDELDADSWLDGLERLAPAAPAARAAADAALHDLVARAEGVSVARWLARREGRSPSASVRVNALVGAIDPAAAADQARRAVARGFRTLKLKLAAHDFEFDLARVEAVRRAVGPGVALRLDANGAWKEADAALRLRALAPFGVEFLEQPVGADERDGLARLCATSPFPIAADEAVRDEATAVELLKRRAAHRLVVKPAAVGGLRAAWRIASRARSAAVPVVVTSFLDSALGRAAALHFAAALPGPLPDAGLATGELLRDDLAPGARVEAGALAVPDAPGLGVAPEPAALRRCATTPTRELRG